MCITHQRIAILFKTLLHTYPFLFPGFDASLKVIFRQFLQVNSKFFVFQFANFVFLGFFIIEIFIQTGFFLIIYCLKLVNYSILKIYGSYLKSLVKERECGVFEKS